MPCCSSLDPNPHTMNRNIAGDDSSGMQHVALSCHCRLSSVKDPVVIIVQYVNFFRVIGPVVSEFTVESINSVYVLTPVLFLRDSLQIVSWWLWVCACAVCSLVSPLRQIGWPEPEFAAWSLPFAASVIPLCVWVLRGCESCSAVLPVHVWPVELLRSDLLFWLFVRIALLHRWLIHYHIELTSTWFARWFWASISIHFCLPTLPSLPSIDHIDHRWRKASVKPYVSPWRYVKPSAILDSSRALLNSDLAWKIWWSLYWSVMASFYMTWW